MACHLYVWAWVVFKGPGSIMTKGCYWVSSSVVRPLLFPCSHSHIESSAPAFLSPSLSFWLPLPLESHHLVYFGWLWFLWSSRCSLFLVHSSSFPSILLPHCLFLSLIQHNLAYPVVHHVLNRTSYILFTLPISIISFVDLLFFFCSHFPNAAVLPSIQNI